MNELIILEVLPDWVVVAEGVMPGTDSRHTAPLLESYNRTTYDVRRKRHIAQKNAMPPLSTLVQQRDQARKEVARLDNATIYAAASLIQGCVLANRARKRLRAERAIETIKSASPQTLRRWLCSESAPLFKNPTLTSILYADYRRLLDRRDIRPLFSSEQGLRYCIEALANCIATYQHQNATALQRRARGVRGRARFHQLRKERIRGRHLHNSSATIIQQMVRGFQQRQRYRDKLLKLFEGRQLLQYQEERQIDKDRRQRAEMRSKMMTLYVHERQRDDSRRLFGADEVKRNDSEDDNDDLAETLASCSKAYLAGSSGLGMPTTRPPSNRSISGKEDKRRLISAYNRERWSRRSRQVAG